MSDSEFFDRAAIEAMAAIIVHDGTCQNDLSRGFICAEACKCAEALLVWRNEAERARRSRS